MRERIILFLSLVVIGFVLYIFQNFVNSIIAFGGFCVLLSIYAIYLILATKHRKRKLLKKPQIINEDYKPFVSVMIPAHNEEKVITSTVNNILSIDYPNFEVIVIDDRSEDNTAEVIKKLEAEHENVKALIRDKDAFPGKSAVLNDAMQYAKGAAILVFDADATVEPDILKIMIPALEPQDVGAVQARKIIRNKDYNILTRCQNNEYTLDTHFQTGRDAVKGAVELRGNGELIKRAALEDIGGWNNYTITDDLDMSTRLHLKGWDIRFCADAKVYEEGVIYLFPLYRQRRRWVEGSIRRYLEFFGQVLVSKDMSLRASLDMTAYISEFILPTWFIWEVIFRTVQYCMGNIPRNDVFLSLVIGVMIGIGFFAGSRYSLRRYDNVPRLKAIKEAFITSVFMLMIWIPTVIFIYLKILFRPKDMNWGKTTHGLVLEEIENQKKQH
ncbi:glycosyltransferase family 2 protein [bacterium]|nr:glycosyltransferase family 2 protein [bacterium]